MLGYRMPSERNRIIVLKSNNLFPLEVNQLIFGGGGGQAAACSLGAWHNSQTRQRTERTRSKKGCNDSDQKLAALGGEWLMCWEMSDWCVCKRHRNCFIFAWHLWRVRLLGLYLSPTADWGDLREENLIINLLRLYEYKRFCNNSGGIYLRYPHYFGEMFTYDLWLWCSAIHQT